jgi:ABC-type branched-subunit amino acid transport system substrate-binding protein
VEYFKVDDESDPSKAVDNATKLVGTVHSGVAMAMAKVAKDTGALLIVPNAGADAVTDAKCAQNIFRSSFSNWQPGYAMAEVMAKRGHWPSADTRRSSRSPGNTRPETKASAASRKRSKGPVARWRRS